LRFALAVLPTFISPCVFGFMRTSAPISFLVSSISLEFFAMADKPQKPAPTGKWKLAKGPLLQMLGSFVLSWSAIEAVIEICISRELGLKPLESSIVTAGLMFKGRSSILRSLLNRDTKKNEKAISIVKKVQEIEDRNDIMHSVIGGNDSQIWFNRRKTNRRFSSKIETYDLERMSALALQCSELATDLMKACKVSVKDYETFFQESHNRANNISV
jgi:hypothetical protein